MSGIFDAVRRSEQPNEGNASNRSSAGGNRGQEMLTSLGSQPESFDLVERVLCQPSPEEHVVTTGENHMVGAEKFRVLCHRLRQIRRQRALHSLLITSATPREGKTFVALNLAAILACGSSRVLLVDADMRHPGIHRTLRLPSLPGLADFLEGRIELPTAFRRVDPLGIYYLSSGSPSSNPVELLQKPKLREWMGQMVAVFDWVVLDSPPLDLFADARYLAIVADAVLLVVREGVTSREDAEQGLAALEGAFVPGVVFNASTSSDHERYYDSYYASVDSEPDRTASPLDQKRSSRKTSNDD